MSNQLNLSSRGYDYSAFTPEDRASLICHAIEIRYAFKQTISNVFVAGRCLSSAREFFDTDDAFVAWCGAEFALGRSQIYRLLAIHKRFGALESEIESSTLVSVLYELASESIDESEAQALATGEQLLPTEEGMKKVSEASVLEIKRYKELLSERDEKIKALKKEIKEVQLCLDEMKKEQKELSNGKDEKGAEKLERLKERIGEREQELESSKRIIEELRRKYESDEVIVSFEERKLLEISVQIKNALLKLRKLSERDQGNALGLAIKSMCEELLLDIKYIAEEALSKGEVIEINAAKEG